MHYQRHSNQYKEAVLNKLSQSDLSTSLKAGKKGKKGANWVAEYLSLNITDIFVNIVNLLNSLLFSIIAPQANSVESKLEHLESYQTLTLQLNYNDIGFFIFPVIVLFIPFDQKTR